MNAVRALAFVALLAPLVAPGGAQAQLFPDNDARKAILELRQQVEAMQKENVGRLERLEQRAAGGQLDLTQQLQAARQEIAQLRGQIEVLQKELGDTQKRQRDQYADLDARVKKTEPQKVTVDGRDITVEVDEQRAYTAAFEQYRASQFAPAAQSFQRFLSQWPNSGYAPIAQFWLGNAQYAARDFKGAIATHRAFVAGNPDSPRSGDALLNVASSQLELNDRVGARKTLREITEKYPDSQAAQGAKERLATIK